MDKGRELVTGKEHSRERAQHVQRPIACIQGRTRRAERLKSY